MSKSNEVHLAYANAPIILAILQFRYERIDEISIKKLRKSISQKLPEYVTFHEQVNQKIDLTPNQTGQTKVLLGNPEIEGLNAISKDSRKIIGIGKDRFSCESHGQYEGWEQFSKHAKEAWEACKSEIGVKHLTGLSLRYVNKFLLPLDTKSISDYFTTFIQSSSGNHNLLSFQLKYTSIDIEEKITSHVGHALVDRNPKNLPYLFDVDVIYQDTTNIEPENIWSIFEELRKKKNLIFNDGITEQAKALIR